MKWFLALYMFTSHKKVISSNLLALEITVAERSARLMLHRLRYAFDHLNFAETVGNTVNIDEFGAGVSENKFDMMLSGLLSVPQPKKEK